jgi:hypothetical protein
MKNLEKFLGTQKQWFCVVVLVLFVTGTAFSQQSRPAAPAPAPAQAAPAPAAPEAAAPAAAKERKNAITFLDTMPLFKGFLMSDNDVEVFFFYLAPAYERLLVPHLAIGGKLDMCFGKVGEDYDGDNIPYFYLGLSFIGRYYPMSEKLEKFFVGAILGFNLQAIDGDTDEEDGGFFGPVIGVEAGYKVPLGKAVFVEPSMSYIYAKQFFGPTPLGWQGGLRVGIRL